MEEGNLRSSLDHWGGGPRNVNLLPPVLCCMEREEAEEEELLGYQSQTLRPCSTVLPRLPLPLLRTCALSEVQGCQAREEARLSTLVLLSILGHRLQQTHLSSNNHNKHRTHIRREDPSLSLRMRSVPLQVRSSTLQRLSSIQLLSQLRLLQTLSPRSRLLLLPCSRLRRIRTRSRKGSIKGHSRG